MGINSLLKKSGLTRGEFAELMGVQEKTTYWAVPPKYAVEYLKVYIRLKQYEKFRILLKEILDE